jgi:hypothetical protein
MNLFATLALAAYAATGALSQPHALPADMPAVAEAAPVPVEFTELEF